MELFEKYKVNPKATKEDLKSFGFGRGTYKIDLYKNMIQLVVHVDIENKWWSYQVHNTDTDFVYVPFYQRNYGANELVDEFDKRIEQILKEMTKKNILIKNKKEKMVALS